MTKLGEELQRRETQRQAMLKQKLDHYSSLERQLQDGLQQLASQQRVLGEREAKVNQESERLARERQLLQDEVQRSQSQFRSQCEQQVEIERYYVYYSSLTIQRSILCIQSLLSQLSLCRHYNLASKMYLAHNSQMYFESTRTSAQCIYLLCSEVDIT